MDNLRTPVSPLVCDTYSDKKILVLILPVVLNRTDPLSTRGLKFQIKIIDTYSSGTRLRHKSLSRRDRCVNFIGGLWKDVDRDRGTGVVGINGRILHNDTLKIVDNK